MKTALTWRKSRRSAPEANCVEVRADLAAIRDTKDCGGPHLSVDVRALVSAIRVGQLD